MQASQKDQTPRIVILRIFWAAIMISCAVIGFIGFQRFGEPIFEGISPPPLALAEAVFALVLSFVIPRIMLRAVKSKLPDDAPFEKLAEAYQVPFILRLAFTEMVALSGLIASIYSKTNLTIPFIATAIFRLIIAFPTEDKIKDVFSRFE